LKNKHDESGSYFQDGNLHYVAYASSLSFFMKTHSTISKFGFAYSQSQTVEKQKSCFPQRQG